MELVRDPPILLLDEPTTGLDSTTAQSLMTLLHNLAINEKRNIICAVHQPSLSMFKKFETLTLLAKGNAVYHGPAREAMDFYQTSGSHFMYSPI